MSNSSYSLPSLLRLSLAGHHTQSYTTGKVPNPGPPPSAAPQELRDAYRQWFSLAVAEADGRRVTPAEAQALYQQILRLTDDTGPLFADAILADEARRFRAATNRCGLCGGPPHAQDRETA